MTGRPPARGPFAELRARREALGYTVEQVSAATRIAVDHLRAIEDGRLDDLPPEPYRRAYLRELSRWLGMDDPVLPAPEPPETPGRLPLWSVQALAVALMAGFLVLVGWQVARGDLRLPEPAPVRRAAERAPSPLALDQQIHLVARQNTRVRVVVDGELGFDGPLAGGAELDFAGQDRIEVDVAAPQDVRIRYNGEAIVPQGRQDLPRRLVFVDDRGPAGR